MREHAPQVDQLLKQIVQLTATRAPTSRDGWAFFLLSSADSDAANRRFDDADLVSLHKIKDLFANRRERGTLDFNQLFAADDIDSVRTHGDFDLIARGRVVEFELLVQRRFQWIPFVVDTNLNDSGALEAIAAQWLRPVASGSKLLREWHTLFRPFD